MRLSTLFLGAAVSALASAFNSAEARSMIYPGSTTIIHEQASDFATAELSGAVLSGHTLTLIPGEQTGTLTSQPVSVAPFDELVPSWNSSTGGGGSVSLEVRAKLAAGWTKWYSFGQWSAAEGRSSLNGQKDAQGQIMTDTLRLSAKADAFQYRVTLRGAETKVRLLAFNTSDRSKRTAGLGQAGDQRAWGKINAVPQRSQMIYPDGGEVWCSPTSVSMILASLGINQPVPQVAHGMYDQAYEGTGNWPFNTAYAGEQGLRAFVTRLPNLAAAEKYTAAGFPLAVSLGWKKGELPGAPVSYSDGHLMVLLGFDPQGNPVLNDPAAPNNNSVRRTYPRAVFEQLWLTHSGGVSYVITRPEATLPQ